MTAALRESLGRLALALRGAGQAASIESGPIARAFAATTASKTKQKVPASSNPPKAASPRGGASTVKKVAKLIKPAPSAYMLFMKNEYGNLKKAQPDISFGEASRRIADMWKHMPTPERARFINESAKLKGAVEAAKNKAKGPKRPLSAYMAYMKEIFPQVKARYPDEKLVDLTRRVGELWRKMDAVEKEQRQKKAEQAKVEFEVKMAKKK